MNQKISLNQNRISELSKDELIEIIEEKNNIIRQQEDFLLNISHDLRNPINVILSILQCMKYVDESKDSKEVLLKREEYNNLIKRNTLKMIKLIDNLIDATKLEGNYYNINKRNLDIVSIVENIVTSIEQFADQKEIQLVFDTNVEACITAFDPECMDRIILNLLSNAIKFSPIGGTIYIYVYVDIMDIKISIKDEGPGIAKEEQQIIFNRFVQATQNSKSEHCGSGIGLELVSYLVKLHQGEINLISNVGKGSEFIVTLPICRVKKEIESNELIKNKKIEQLEVEFSDIYL